MIATTIEQSKKLLELGLSPESADMCYILISIDDYGTGTYKPALLEEPFKENLTSIPCWSLAALLGCLPFPVLYMEMVAGMIFWCCECNFIETDEMFKIEHYDNPIDACVAMIEKLHELNLL